MLTVAIVGRPNVGKSTLFNRLIRQKLALVDDQPGVTRDTREGMATIADLKFKLFDTAGLDKAKKGSLEARMSDQTMDAAKSADVILFVIDGKMGVTAIDKDYAQLVRRLGKRTFVLVNKTESRTARQQVAEAHVLGLGDPIAIAAEHGEGLGDIYDALIELRPEEQEESEEADEPKRPLKLAIMGQPNAGKSTLVNSMLDQERMLTGPEAGITRDAIASDWSWKGRAIKLWDTAGIRRKSRVREKVEKLAVSDAMNAIKFAECVVVLLDATLPIERQDLTLCDLAGREGRAVVLALNKWDAVEDKQRKLRDVQSDIDDVLPDIRGVPIVPVSGKQGKGIDKLMAAVLQADKRWNSRVSTGKLNRWLEEIVQVNAPPAPSGRRIKIKYMTQASARPPNFALFGNQLDKLPDSYLRFLTNKMRETFDLKGIPIRFSLRGGKNPYDKE
jgi:GTPase